MQPVTEQVPTRHEPKGTLPPPCCEEAALRSLACAAFDLTMLLAGVALYACLSERGLSLGAVAGACWWMVCLGSDVNRSAMPELRRRLREALGALNGYVQSKCALNYLGTRAVLAEGRSAALRAACTVHQPADCVDAWTAVFAFVGSLEDELEFAKVCRPHAGIARAAHERRGLKGWVWWRSDPTVRSFLASLLQGSLPGRQRVVAPVYAYEVKSEYSNVVVKFAGLPLVPPVVEHATHHIGFYLKGLKDVTPFNAEAEVARPYNCWYIWTPRRGHGERALLGAVDEELQWISIDTKVFGKCL